MKTENGSCSDIVTSRLIPARGRRERALSLVWRAVLVVASLFASLGTARADGIETISAGVDHTCLATTSGGVRCWGLGNDGRLGVKPSDAALAAGAPDPRNTASNVAGLPSSIALVSLGGEMSCAETTDLVTMCWGRNDYGQLGSGSSEPYSFAPTPVKDLGGAKALSVGSHSACAVVAGGGVKCWGRNDHGQLGDGTLGGSNAPVSVAGISSGASDVSVGEDHACAVVKGGVRCWGRNHQGQLGDGSTQDSVHPVKVPGVHNATKVFVGPGVSYAITTGGSVMMWGWGKPTPSAFSAVGNGISSIAVGELHGCALSNKGAVQCWGNNAKGQLGDGTQVDRVAPVSVIGLSSGGTGIAAGRDHSCALKKSGEVVCWGAGALGQRGDGGTSPSDIVTAPKNGGVLGSAKRGSGATTFTTQSLTVSDNSTSSVTGSTTPTASPSSGTPTASAVAASASTSGLQLALDFNTGAAGSSIQPVGRTTDGVYMVATNQAGETHLLRASSDGRVEQIKRLSPNPEQGGTTVTSGLFFTIPTGLAGAGERWYTDGTWRGTLRVPCTGFSFHEGPRIYYRYPSSSKLGWFNLYSGDEDKYFVTTESKVVNAVVSGIPVSVDKDGSIYEYHTDTDQWVLNRKINLQVTRGEWYPRDGSYYIAGTSDMGNLVYRITGGVWGLNVTLVSSLIGTGFIGQTSWTNPTTGVTNEIFYIYASCGSRSCSPAEQDAAKGYGYAFRVYEEQSIVVQEYPTPWNFPLSAAPDPYRTTWVYPQNGQLYVGTSGGTVTPHQRLTWNSQEIIPTALRIVGDSLFIFGSTAAEGSEVWVTPYDSCPDTNKYVQGVCGCGVADVDRDSDGVMDCQDLCPTDAAKTQPGTCGCGAVDEDPDGDGVMSCKDECPSDAQKSVKGSCGCGVADTDSDKDGKADCVDLCAADPDKSAPGVCGCGVADTDSDSDGKKDCQDQCPQDAQKTSAGICGCGVSDNDSDGDNVMDCQDLCISDPQKQAPGACGCGKTDADLDADGVPNCNDGCPQDPLKTTPGIAGCGKSDTDTDGDGTPDSLESCPNDKAKLSPGACGCGVVDQDSDNDGTADCSDQCVQDPNKVYPGSCGCGVPETDSDNDGAPDCIDQCPNNPWLMAPDGGSCEVKPTPTPLPILPDLSMTSVWSGLAEFKRGQPWSFTGETVNVGSGKSNAGTVTWYLSRDKILSVKSDLKLGAARLKAMNPAQFQSVKLKVSGKATSKVPAGKYWLIGTVSDEMNVSEVARANNLSVSARQITVKK